MTTRVGTIGFVLAALGVAAAVAHGSVSSDGALTPASESIGQAAASDSLLGVFEGRTPCGELFVEFTGYASPACEKMKWWLALYRDAIGAPSRYEFNGTRVRRTGRWVIERGAASNPNAVVYRLLTDLPVGFIALLRADDNVLLLLDRERRLMVGDASWSYTLSRTE